MDEPLSKTGSPTVAILYALDQVLLRHLERITGTSRGIQGLPMDLMTVTCIVLLMEHIEEAGREGNGGRLNRSDLEDELSEMGLDDPPMVEQTLTRMAEAGYIEMDAKQRMVPGKPAFSMARLLDHAFPGMPGMNLVAYFVQTLDELETGRKDSATALMQLDQMLRRHGAAPFRQHGEVRKGTKAGGSAGPSSSRPEDASVSSRTKAPNRDRRPLRPRENRLVFRSPKQSAPGSSHGDRNRRNPGPDDGIDPRLEPADTPTPLQEREPPPAPLEREEEPTQAVDPAGGAETGHTGPNVLQEPLDTAEAGTPFEPETAPEPPSDLPTDTEQGLDIEPVDEPEPVPDEDAGVSPVTPAGEEEGVEERIAAFENTLAMECPVCRQASVKVRETAKGRVYYQCTSDACMFISWGRPHHIPCPRCGNPFLVESTARSGETLLKCPRATCRYTFRQEADASPKKSGSAEADASIPTVRKKKRRVVKRRVVRRKR